MDRLKCRSFKCGPDYIDPMFHKDVLNRSFCSEAYRKADRGNRDDSGICCRSHLGTYDHHTAYERLDN